MKRILLSTLVLTGTMLLPAADPYAGYIYPAGIQAGTTNRFIVGGQNLWGVRDVAFSQPGLHVLKIERVPGFAPPSQFTGVSRKASYTSGPCRVSVVEGTGGPAVTVTEHVAVLLPSVVVTVIVAVPAATADT